MTRNRKRSTIAPQQPPILHREERERAKQVESSQGLCRSRQQQQQQQQRRHRHSRQQQHQQQHQSQQQRQLHSCKVFTTRDEDEREDPARAAAKCANDREPITRSTSRPLEDLRMKRMARMDGWMDDGKRGGKGCKGKNMSGDRLWCSLAFHGNGQKIRKIVAASRVRARSTKVSTENQYNFPWILCLLNLIELFKKPSKLQPSLNSNSMSWS